MPAQRGPSQASVQQVSSTATGGCATLGARTWRASWTIADADAHEAARGVRRGCRVGHPSMAIAAALQRSPIRVMRAAVRAGNISLRLNAALGDPPNPRPGLAGGFFLAQRKSGPEAAFGSGSTPCSAGAVAQLADRLELRKRGRQLRLRFCDLFFRRLVLHR